MKSIFINNSTSEYISIGLSTEVILSDRVQSWCLHEGDEMLGHDSIITVFAEFGRNGGTEFINMVVDILEGLIGFDEFVGGFGSYTCYSWNVV
jgi:hypothetical protein